MQLVDRRPGRTLVVASVAAFMTSLDTMVVTTALPTMRRQLGGSTFTTGFGHAVWACAAVSALGVLAALFATTRSSAALDSTDRQVDRAPEPALDR